MCKPGLKSGCRVSELARNRRLWRSKFRFGHLDRDQKYPGSQYKIPWFMRIDQGWRYRTDTLASLLEGRP